MLLLDGNSTNKILLNNLEKNHTNIKCSYSLQLDLLFLKDEQQRNEVAI